MLQKDEDPGGKRIPRGANAGISRGPRDEDERRAAAGAGDGIEVGEGRGGRPQATE